MWFSGHGGGRHYGNHNRNHLSTERNLGARHIYIDSTDQPVSFYGANMEMGKSHRCGVPTTNLEITGATAGMRLYGTKREGRAGTGVIHNSTNVGIFGQGKMTGAAGGPGATSDQAYFSITGTSNHVVIGPHIVGTNIESANAASWMVKEQIAATGNTTFNASPWPTGVTLYKRGTLDDTPFTATAPPPQSPEMRTVHVEEVDTIHVCWTIFDSAALLPASGATEFTVTVNSGGGADPKVPTSVVRQGLDCYFLSFTAGTITSGSHVVIVTYTPGNITSGTGSPPAPALAFGPTVAQNFLAPASAPVLSQTAFMFRSLSGAMDLTSSPPYVDSSSAYENVPARFLQGAKFRVHMKVANNNVDSPPLGLAICYEKNESGTYIPLTDTCTSGTTCFTNAPDLGDLAPTIEQLTPTEATFVPGALLEHETTQSVVNLPMNSETGYEAAIQIDAAASIGDRFRYRMCKSDDTPLDSYPQTPLVTVISHRSSIRGGLTE
jgi:hypothetical protein